MSTHDDDSPDVHAALLRIADDSFIAPPWREAVARLGPRSTAEEPLAVYQAICDSGWLLADEGFYLVASLVEELTDAEAETSLGEMDARLAAIEKELEGEQDESRPGYELVDEHERLSQQCQDAWDDIFLNKLAAAGEQYIADLYQENRKEFARHYAAGERCFQAAAETYKEVSPDDLVSVASYLNLPSAELARNELEKAGIFSALGNANFVYWNWDCSNASGGIRVNVRRGDARRACSELVAPRARDEESRPSWTCRSCGRRIPGEWAACWQCGASPDATVGGPGTRDT